MKRETFYRMIGDIDDDLIQAANEARGQKSRKPMLYRIAGIAACFCLICGGILLGRQKDTVYINEAHGPMIAKVVVPNDENTQIISMNYQELLAYYGIEQLPDALGEALTRQEQSFFTLYEDPEGNILFDTNILYYNSPDRSKTLSIVLSRAKESPGMSAEGMKMSDIDGVPMLLKAASNGSGYTAYLAELESNGIFVKMISDGLSEDEFISAIKELLPSVLSD